MRKSQFSEPRGRRSSSTSTKLALVLGVLILAAAGLVGTGCSFSNFLSPGGTGLSTDTPPVLPSPAVKNSPLPEPTPTIPELPLEPWGEIQGSYSFEYLCNPYTITLPLYQSTYEYFLSKDKNFYYHGTLPEDWQKQFYQNFLASNHDQETVKELIAEVRGAIGQGGDELVIALINLVQTLTYDCDKLFSYDHLDGEGYQTNFPYETLYSQKGVCGDTTILLGKILGELGYGSAFLVYEGNNHMALGIQCPVEVATYIEGQRGYCYVETTGPTRIGIKPTSLGGKEFVEYPKVIPITEGKSFARMVSLVEEREQAELDYGNMILQLATCQEIEIFQEIKERKKTLTAHDGHLASLRIKRENAENKFYEEFELYKSMGCEGTLPQKEYELCMTQQAIVEEAYAVYEELVNEYNRVIGLRNAEVNRMNLAIEIFNSLMDANNQGCAAVFSERITMEEESE